MIKLLIFDLDGTLADTIKDITHAVNYAVERYGVKPLAVGEIRAMVGSGITNLIEGLILPQFPQEKGGDFPAKKMDAVKRFIDYYSAHLLDYTRPYPEVKETLVLLTDYKKAVISNKREALSKKVLEGLELLEFFDIVLGSDSVPEKKPSPVPVFEILSSLGFSRDEAVIIGDSNYDVEAGRAAGIKTIAVTYGYRSREVLKEADFIVDSFGEIIRIINEINCKC